MEETSTRNVSTALYQYLCQYIVGTEEHVKTIRMMNSVRDDYQSTKKEKMITSGSFGEGLEMRGSDIDVMLVRSDIEVSEDTPIYFNAAKVHFTMDMANTKSGYTQLRLHHYKYKKIFKLCHEIGNDFFLSNLSFKQAFSSKMLPTMHGPCISDTDEKLDVAYCLHSKLWITPAKQWVIRSNNSWPKYDVKQAIVKHGVLFVPVGVKGSSQEELEWRLSFSVGEKLLMYSFTHTQLQCYALLKILLKDVIALDRECKELLCSYFIKTILFWICEELPPSIWKPENLIFCFMRCFRRLIYCVEYTVCPHYFIPENNLFGNKIFGHAQELLLNTLYILNSYDWQCILFSYQISSFSALSCNINTESSYLHVNKVEQLILSQLFLMDSIESVFEFLLKKGIHKELFSKSSKIKYLYTFYVSNYCCKCERILPFDDLSGNKSYYRKSITYINTLLLNIRHDTVSGWLMLASFYYKIKQFNKALYIVQYSLSKCAQKKLQIPMNISDIHYELLSLHLNRRMTIVQFWRYLLLDYVMFAGTSRLIPIELEMEVHCVLPPVVYAHFLGLLCHYHLQNSWQYRNSCRDLQLTIQENSLIPGDNMKSKCYNILGICFQLLGDTGSARQAFMQSVELFPDEKNNTAFQRLSLIG